MSLGFSVTMNFIPVWKRQLTPYTNVRPRVQKLAQHRIAHPLRQWPTQLRLCGFFQQFLNRTYTEAKQALPLVCLIDLPASYLKRNISLIFRIVILQFALPSSLKWTSIASCF